MFEVARKEKSEVSNHEKLGWLEIINGRVVADTKQSRGKNNVTFLWIQTRTDRISVRMVII